MLAVEEFPLPRGPERFDEHAVDGGRNAAHLVEQASFAQAMAKDPGCVSRASVRVNDDAVWRSLPARHLEVVDYELSPDVMGDPPAQDALAPRISGGTADDQPSVDGCCGMSVNRTRFDPAAVNWRLRGCGG